MREVRIVWEDDIAPTGKKFLAIGNSVWGKGITPQAAKKEAKKNGNGGKNWIYILGDEATNVNDWGSICYPDGSEPEQVVVFVR